LAILSTGLLHYIPWYQEKLSEIYQGLLPHRYLKIILKLISIHYYFNPFSAVSRSQQQEMPWRHRVPPN